MSHHFFFKNASSLELKYRVFFFAVCTRFFSGFVSARGVGSTVLGELKLHSIQKCVLFLQRLLPFPLFPFYKNYFNFPPTIPFSLSSSSFPILFFFCFFFFCLCVSVWEFSFFFCCFFIYRVPLFLLCIFRWKKKKSQAFFIFYPTI